jgi:AmmeMemoRadiSam system protein A
MPTDERVAAALTDADRRALLEIARAAIAVCVGDGQPVELSLSDALTRPGGAFVTLHHGGALRGCIGNPAPDDSLADVVARCAAASATEDPRFAPLSREELADLTLEISVLGPIEVVVTIEEIQIGRHGLIVELGRRRGLLLPQVATEWEWDRETFLVQTCKKAGLAPDAWQRGAKIFRFEAEIIRETG